MNKPIKINKKNIFIFLNYLFQKIKKIFNRENIGLILFIISLSLGYKYFNISENTTKIFINLWFIIFIFYNLLFKFKETEEFLIKNISIIIFLSLLFIFYNQNKLGLSNNELFIIIGGTFAFWYGYKKYERDKEMKNLELLLNNYFNIDFEEKIGYMQLIFNYKENGYISNIIFDYIDNKFWFNIDIYLDEYFNKLIKEGNNKEEIGNLVTKKFIELIHTDNINYILYIKGNFEKLLEKEDSKYKKLYNTIIKIINDALN